MLRSGDSFVLDNITLLPINITIAGDALLAMAAAWLLLRRRERGPPSAERKRLPPTDREPGAIAPPDPRARLPGPPRRDRLPPPDR